MLLCLPQIVRTNLIILLLFIVITNVDCRPGGRGRGGRLRGSKLTKNKFNSNNVHRQLSSLRKPSNPILVSAGGAGLVVGTLALRSFISNNNKVPLQSRRLLTNGTGNVCVNRENYSNFIFNEFRCPLSPIYTANDRYCCGTYQQQYCCSFWERHRTIGLVIGIISACSLFVVFLIYSIVYYRRYLKRKESSRIKSYIRHVRVLIEKASDINHNQFELTMRTNHSLGWLISLFAIALLVLSVSEGKGVGGGRGGGGFRGGSKTSGSFGGSSSYNRVNTMNKPRSGSSFKGTAMNFAAGAAGGVVAYSLMRSMSGSYRSRPEGYYGSGYGVGETCVNNEDMNGTTFGEFRCPLYGFPMDAKYCCGEYGEQFCCRREPTSRFSNGAGHFGWIVLGIVILLIIIILWARRNRRQQKEMMMIPTEPPMNEAPRPSPFYQPPPPASGYPPPPGVNPYAVPPQQYNPYAQQSHMQYPPQQQPYNPY